MTLFIPFMCTPRVERESVKKARYQMSNPQISSVPETIVAFLLTFDCTPSTPVGECRMDARLRKNGVRLRPHGRSENILKKCSYKLYTIMN